VFVIFGVLASGVHNGRWIMAANATVRQ
jgi:hypothetical protein